MKQDFKPLALVVGGSLIASIISFLLGLKYLYAAILIVIVGFSFAYGLGILQAALKRYRQHHRLRNIRIGVLNDICWNIEGSHARTDVTPDEWMDNLIRYFNECGVKPRIEKTKVSSKIEKYSAILNPYGSVYPETDLGNLETLHKVLEYVNEGGLFISVADMPFYYAYDNRIKRKVVQQPPGFFLNTNAEYGDYKPNPFTKQVGLEICNLDGGGGPVRLHLNLPEGDIEVECRRGAVVWERIIGHLLTTINKTNVSTKTNKLINVAPVFSILYGKGEFLISTIWITDDENQKVRDAIIHKICILILEYLGKTPANIVSKRSVNSTSNSKKDTGEFG